MLHNHNPDATWETTLVIPEATKPVEVQTLDTLLRIEVLLTQLLADRDGGAVEGDVTDLISNIEPRPTPFADSISDKKPKGKRKA